MTQLQARILTGLKPTGTPHLGNYAGMIKPTLNLLRERREGDEYFFFIPDLHALNSLRDGARLSENIKMAVLNILAFMEDGEIDNVFIFQQSNIEAIGTLATMMSAYCPKGMMNRAHAYKAAIDQHDGTVKGDDMINMGLYCYPILMMADILSLQSTHIPVGADQKQHVEYARDIATKINFEQGAEILKVPEPFVRADMPVLSGMDGRKMSKSYDNIIPLFAEPDDLRKRIFKIKTDSRDKNAPKDPNDLLFSLYREFAAKQDISAMEKAYKEGLAYGQMKEALFEALNSYLAKPRERLKGLSDNFDQVIDKVEAGNSYARSIANQTLDDFKGALGLTVMLKG